MPYIKQKQRAELERRAPQNAGELNYILSRRVSEYIGDIGISYQTLHDVVGVLRDVATEIERRFMAPYEDSKGRVNGEVFHEVKDAVEAARKAQD